MQTTQTSLELGQAVWEAVLERGCGLDVHQKTVTACLLIGPLEEQPRESLRTFHTTTRGLLKPSLIPPTPIRDLRDLCRYRRKLIEQTSAEKNRVQKVLEDANIKLATVASNVFGVSGQAMIRALLETDMTPEEMANLAKGKLREKIPQLIEALEGEVSEHHRFLIRMHLEHMGYLKEAVAQLDERIEEKIQPYQRQVEIIRTTPGFDTASAQHAFVEIGGDIGLFPSEKHLASWAGLCPGNNESAGKQKSGRTTKGNVWLKCILVRTAHASCRTKDTYLKSFYRRVAARRGKGRAIIAVAHKQVRAIYHELREDKSYRELGGDFFDRLNQKALEQRLTRRLEDLGYRVELHPVRAT